MNRETPIEWQLAGLCTEDTGKVDRLFSGDYWMVPSTMGIEDDSLYWFSSKHHIKKVAPASGMMETFVNLHEASPGDILKYARHWGPLGICQHNLPASHSFPSHIASYDDLFRLRTCSPVPSEKKHGYYAEPLWVWRQFSREAHGILWIASRLHLKRLGHVEDWRAVFPLFGNPQPHQSYIPSADVERRRVAYLVQRWLGLGGVRPRFCWNDSEPTFQLGGPAPEGAGLFSALALQLMLIVYRVDGIIICSGCGSPAIPTRRPRLQENSYCQSCRDTGVPAKLGMRRMRAGDSNPRRVKRRKKRNRSTKKAR